MRNFLERLGQLLPPDDITLYDTNKHEGYAEMRVEDNTVIEEPTQAVKAKKKKKKESKSSSSKKIVDEDSW